MRPRARAVIINADDLGYDPAVTRGILRALREGIVTSATLLVNTPWSAQAARDARGLSVGLHLNLARGTPAWSAFPTALLNDGLFDESRAPTLPPDVAEAECLSQLERFHALAGQRPTHVDVHKHLHRHPGVLEGLIRAARATGLPVRALDPAMHRAFASRGVASPSHFLGETGATAHWTLERLEATVSALPAEGITELMCHPGFAPEQVKSRYAEQREVELATFLHPRASQALARAGVTTVDFRALTAEAR
ncbi:ChbG/HpnK family deacetylase [Corallococcus sp. M34]|uniref:carbohydrate deacetylase n=1 Tax=Citreicoccus inhibens TaxID=2849499 RepID=UPI001C21F880|nr:ChbG/HpnK family deacetylase [Citreicoccus inhibens]MBU8895398.1 ChbG/HpnK family deacetylase [Citreicoccus inhibens]